MFERVYRLRSCCGIGITCRAQHGRKVFHIGLADLQIAFGIDEVIVAVGKAHAVEPDADCMVGGVAGVDRDAGGDETGIARIAEQGDQRGKVLCREDGVEIGTRRRQPARIDGLDVEIGAVGIDDTAGRSARFRVGRDEVVHQRLHVMD